MARGSADDELEPVEPLEPGGWGPAVRAAPVRPPRRRWTWAIAAAAGALVLVAVAVGVTSGEHEHRDVEPAPDTSTSTTEAVGTNAAADVLGAADLGRSLGTVRFVLAQRGSTWTSELLIDVDASGDRTAITSIDSRRPTGEVRIVGDDAYLRTGDGPWRHARLDDFSSYRGLQLLAPAFEQLRNLSNLRLDSIADLAGDQVRRYRCDQVVGTATGYLEGSAAIQALHDRYDAVVPVVVDLAPDGRLVHVLVTTGDVASDQRLRYDEPVSVAVPAAAADVAGGDEAITEVLR